MATYDELLAQYQRFPSWGPQRQMFLNQHPKFAERLAGGGNQGGASGYGGGRVGWPGWIGGGVTVPPGTTPPDAPAPVKDPNDPCPDGWHLDPDLGMCVRDATGQTDDPCPPGWHYDEATKRCIKDDEEDAEKRRKHENDLYSQYKKTLEEFGLLASEDFLHQAIREDWSEDTFIIRMREQDFYLANPLFRANLNRGKQGKGFDSEGTVLAYADSIRRIARTFGYAEPSDNLIAMSIEAKGTTAKSAAEFESKIRAWQRLEDFGRPIQDYAEEYLRRNLSDEDLMEFFDPDIPDPEWVKAFKYAEYRGRPILLGFEGRSEAEARAYEMLGYTPDQVNELFRTAQGTKFSTQHLATLEADLLAGMNPEQIREILKGHEDLVVQADVLQLPEARRRLQELLLREGARWNTGAGALATTTGVQVGLLSPQEKASFG